MAKGIPDKRVQRIRATAKGALHDSIESWKQTLPVKPEQLCGNEQAKVIGENVYHFRKEAKMSLKVVAEELGISLQALSRIENGDRDKIDIDLFYGLMIVLSCTHDNLLGRAKQRGYVYDDILAGILELSAACLLLFLPVVSIDSFVGSISVNLMKFSGLVAGSLSYGATSFDNAMWGMLALVIPWIVIGCATISGIAALLKPSKISYTLYMNQSGPLGVLFALILYYITGNLMGFTPNVGLWLALGLSAGSWVAGWKNFQLVRAELTKASRKLQK